MKIHRNRLVVLCAALAGIAGPALAQDGNTTGNPLDPQPNGPRKSDPTHHVLLDATVHPEPGVVLDHAVIEIEDGRIVRVLADAADYQPPADAQVHDCTGLHVYAGFIDAHLPIDAPRPDLNAPGSHWNAGVTPQRSALDAGGVPAGDAEKLRKLGFTAAAIAPDGGIFAGRAAVVSLAQAPADPSDGRPPVYREDVYQALSLSSRGTPSNRGEFTGYPNSQMGVIALMRQTLSDADWLAATSISSGAGVSPAASSCLTSLTTDLPLLFRTQDELEGLRAFKVAREFGRIPFIIGCGTEFRRLDAIPVGPKGHTGFQPHYILPLTFPETPDLDTIGKADSTDLRTLMTWEQAPTNPRRLDEIGVHVSLTASGLRKGEKFDKNLREAIKTGGLDPDRALAMLTTNPAAMLGVADQMGTVEPGKLANLVVATGDLFQSRGRKHAEGASGAHSRGSSEDPTILTVWIDGAPHQINPPPPPFDGTWTFRVGEFFEMTFIIDGDKVTGIEGPTEEGGDDASEGPARNVKINANTRTISFLTDDTDDGSGTYVISGTLGPDGVIRGTGLGADNTPFEWTATRTEPEAQARNQPEDNDNADDADNTDDAEQREASGEDDDTALPPDDLPGYPFGPYALSDLPPQQTVIFYNATIWTSGPDGIIDNGWIAIEDGRIIAVREGGVIDIMTRHDPVMIDLQGRHITPGLLDAHSHTGISRGVNESGQAVTAEVRIGDVTDPDSINWYRQLTGGVTIVNSMHGSANPIGGQTQTNKVRWGVASPDDMHMEGAKPGIKFALGENVKQSNWESDQTRYPQARMGVETLIRDRFAAAREYAEVRATERRSDEATKGETEYAAGGTDGLPGDVGDEDTDISRPDRLAEVDGPRQSNLSRLREDAAGRTVWIDPTDAGLGLVGAGQHRGGPRATEPTGLHPVSEDRPGVAPRDYDPLRTGNLHDDVAREPTNAGTHAGSRSSTARTHPEPRSQEPAKLTEASPPSSLRRSVAPSLLPPRRDLELEALAEILAGERLVHCHSYRQDEILMLCRVAEDFGFTIGTFQHGLEVYKVAEAVKDHAIGASLFADWWAYKVEVQDAIAQAGPLQTEVGVLTSYNSDSDELSRRMNVEAAKAYKYSGGRLSKEDALKFVTINPAIQLGIEARVGSIEVGKDADLAVWSGEPLSAFSMCEATWIDGREYFSLERDAALREQNAAHRTRITQRILTKGAPKARSGSGKDEDTEDNTTDADPPPTPSLRERMASAARTRHYLDLYLRGINPADHRCGDCGASDLQFGGQQ